MSNKSRKQKLDVLSPSKDESRDCADETPTDWTRCIFSHNVKPEKLVNPTESKRRSNCKQTLIIYRKTFENLRQKAYPISQSINVVTLGRHFSETCLLHHAKFHEMCRKSSDNHHFQKAKKSIDHSAETPSEPSERYGKTLC